MKKLTALIGLCILASNFLLSCRERLDLENQAGFVKSHGFDKESYANDMIELDNGDLLIVGQFLKTSTIGGEEIDGPFILRTDANGNELKFQNFYFTRAIVSERTQLYSDWVGVSLTDTLEFTGASFNEVAQLKNGNFLVIGSFFAGWQELGGLGDSFDFLMIMDENFELQEFKFFYNSQAEFQSGRERYFGGQVGEAST